MMGVGAEGGVVVRERHSLLGVSPVLRLGGEPCFLIPCFLNGIPDAVSFVMGDVADGSTGSEGEAGGEAGNAQGEKQQCEWV
jgi:hypothetical protein